MQTSGLAVTVGADVAVGASIAGMGVSVASGTDVGSCVGGRKGVGVGAGAQLDRKKIPANKINEYKKRQMGSPK